MEGKMIYYILYLVISILVTSLLFNFLKNKWWAIIFLACAAGWSHFLLPNIEGVSNQALALVFIIMGVFFLVKARIKGYIK